MQTAEEQTAFFHEMRRVLRGDGPTTTDFFRVQQPVPAGTLKEVTMWLRTLPTGIGEAELEARVRARYGAPPSGGVVGDAHAT